jgi:hypothetical protein
MKRFLLLGSVLLASISAYPQNRMSKPSGVLESKMKRYDINEMSTSASSVFTGPSKQIKHKLNPQFKVAAANQFTGSMNVFGYLVSQQKPLQFNSAVNAVSFIARKSSTYTPSSNGNSGTIVGHYTTNFGGTWNSSCIWANANSLARYPQGGIYNPLGNTNINNAYLVGTGPFTSSAPTWGGTTNGNWYASKPITTPGTNTPGADQQPSFFQGGFLKSHYMSRYSFTAIDGGLVRSMANIVNDADATTNSSFGLRGALMVKGTFNAGAFVWSVDSFKPPVAVSVATPTFYLFSSATPLQAWDNTGTTGYVVMIGVRAGAPSPMTGYQPFVYKTTNGGASWSLFPANDFADPNCFKGVYDRLYPISSNTNVIVANFGQTEGWDITVDNTGNLHLATMLLGHYSDHPDSLGYRNVFGTEQYSYGYTGPFDFPTIYDFYTCGSSWNYHIVDSMATEGPSGTSGQPGYGSNIWSDGSGAKMDQDARIQISRSDDGSKIFYSWTESDPSVLGLNWNVFPDLKVRGFDVLSKQVTPRMNATGGVTNADQSAYYHYMSNKAAGSSSGCMTMPLTITYNSTYNGSIDVNTYYLDNIQLCASSFSINSLAPKTGGCTTCLTGIGNAEEVFDYSVSNFPNPAREATTMRIELKDASAFDMAIYNSVGQLMDIYKMKGQPGINEINVNLSNYAPGIYFYKVKVGKAVMTKKLVVQ